MKIHIVQKGDTLWKLAQQYHVNFEELKAVNSQLTNPDLIMPGMKIKIPTGGVPIKKEAPKHMHVPKEKPIAPKEKPIISPPPVKEMPHMPPPTLQPMPQPIPQMPPPMTQQQMQAIDMNFNFYKQQMPPPPMVMPQMKAEAPKKVKKEKPIYKEKPKLPKEKPVLGEQLPPPPPPMPQQELPMQPMQPMQPLPMPMPVMPIQQPCAPCYPEPIYPISPVIPGCANTMTPYYPQQMMYMPQQMYPIMPQMMPSYYPTNYYQPTMDLGYGQYPMPAEQMMYAEQFPQPMRMYQTPDQFREDDDFDE